MYRMIIFTASAVPMVGKIMYRETTTLAAEPKPRVSWALVLFRAMALLNPSSPTEMVAFFRHWCVCQLRWHGQSHTLSTARGSGSVKPPQRSRESAQCILDVINLEPEPVKEGEVELHFSVLTSMFAQSCQLRMLSPKLPVSEAVVPRYSWETGTTAQSPFRCSDVLPTSRMSSANNVSA